MINFETFWKISFHTFWSNFSKLSKIFSSWWRFARLLPTIPITRNIPRTLMQLPPTLENVESAFLSANPLKNRNKNIKHQTDVVKMVWRMLRSVSFTSCFLRSSENEKNPKNLLATKIGLTRLKIVTCSKCIMMATKHSSNYNLP